LRILFSKNIKKLLCNALGLYDMHASLPSLKYRPPSLMLHHHKVLLQSKAFLVFLIHKLLSLLIKPDHASKYGVVWASTLPWITFF
jgi:hypothetical protein